MKKSNRLFESMPRKLQVVIKERVGVAQQLIGIFI